METLITFVTLIIVIIQVWTWILFIKTTFNVQKIKKVIVDKKNESEQIICEDIRRDLVTINIIVASCNDNEKAKKTNSAIHVEYGKEMYGLFYCKRYQRT